MSQYIDEAAHRSKDASMRECADDLAAAVARGRRMLQAAGMAAEDAARDAGLLARWVLGWDAATWLVRSRETHPSGFLDPFLRAIERRARHEPIAYIVGERQFYGRPFFVSPAVLIPRPETEFVVEEALAALADGVSNNGSPALADVGTGSGCLAITLALEQPRASIVATDISEPALAIARRNARRLGVGERVTFLHGAFLAQAAGPFDLIVANPPYVSEGDRGSLPIEIERFEPAEALFAGDDGLGAIRKLLPLASATLAAGGWLIMEIGQGQLTAVRDLIDRTLGLTFDHDRLDLQGIPRVVAATRKPD
jgi:release factor glutamine methyltransferase